MNSEIIRERLKVFYKLDIETAPITTLENALKEMSQEIALRALAMSGFFKKGFFHGGTCLRIIHKAPRFSEDMDFSLMSPDPEFEIAPHMVAIQDELHGFGLESNIQDRSKEDVAVAKAFFKMQAIDKILNIKTNIGRRKQVRIRIDIDTNPPAGKKMETATILWPSVFPIIIPDISSLFAGKLHALLARLYEKGRDWYDFIWYVQQGSDINYIYLKNALVQTGDIASDVIVDIDFVKTSLRKKLESINLQRLKDDTIPFLKDGHEIDFWTKKSLSSVIEELRA